MNICFLFLEWTHLWKWIKIDSLFKCFETHLLQSKPKNCVNCLQQILAGNKVFPDCYIFVLFIECHLKLLIVVYDVIIAIRKNMFSKFSYLLIYKLFFTVNWFKQIFLCWFRYMMLVIFPYCVPVILLVMKGGFLVILLQLIKL